MADKTVDQQFSRDYELISATYHEAGHVIIGLLHFIKIDVVAVSLNDPNEVGITHYDVLEPAFIDNDITALLYLSEIKLYYAGLMAERIYYKDMCGSDKFPTSLKGGCSEDFEKAAAVIKKYNLAEPGEKRYLFKQKIMRQIRKLLEEHWDAVKLIAHMLYAKKRIDYETLKELLIKKTTPIHRKFWKEQFREINLLFADEKVLDIETTRLIIKP